MDKFNKISDEQLGAYLDGMLSDEASAMVDAEMDIDTFEVLQVSMKAEDEIPSDNIISVPSWGWGYFMNEASMDDDNDDE